MINHTNGISNKRYKNKVTTNTDELPIKVGDKTEYGKEHTYLYHLKMNPRNK